MRSGNGRHRRPRQAPALFVAAGVTGAGIALPLLGATGAHAADASPWDRVADCESGGVWSANNGHGYYGGLQLDLDTWKYYGGTVYADRPDLASRSQQIAVGEKILEAEGPRSFPHCGSVLAGEVGPDVDLGTPDGTDPGADEGADPDGSDHAEDGATSGDPSGRESPEAGAPDGKPSEGETSSEESSDGKASEGESSGESEGESSGEKASGEEGAAGEVGGSGGEGGSDGSASERPSATPSPSAPSGSQDADSGDPADAGASDPSEGGFGWSNQGPSSPERLRDSSGEQGHVLSPGTGKHRGTPDEGSDRASRGDDREDKGEGSGKHRVTVRPGDSLSRIAAEQDVPGGWTELYAHNRGVIGDDPDLIKPGQQLRV
ncbi:LysM peptidoglycan-binding domain-containing protein [Streptomyces diacarni]|uniref:LysM peptidoglycan-binding domain-containing protein n=1 Tax=Streptomyces diacarni TaxID=2800381 RepID=A0A367EID3_9ACTN|nr:transglycosylase family protein [Streptomyces diacarni]RCG17858.1 LysM peptidoglycan-binding domain-containing protein [Streptomyces diacarni]